MQNAQIEKPTTLVFLATKVVQYIADNGLFEKPGMAAQKLCDGMLRNAELVEADDGYVQFVPRAGSMAPGELWKVNHETFAMLRMLHECYNDKRPNVNDTTEASVQCETRRSVAFAFFKAW